MSILWLLFFRSIQNRFSFGSLWNWNRIQSRKWFLSEFTSSAARLPYRFNAGKNTHTLANYVWKKESPFCLYSRIELFYVWKSRCFYLILCGSRVALKIVLFCCVFFFYLISFLVTVTYQRQQPNAIEPLGEVNSFGFYEKLALRCTNTHTYTLTLARAPRSLHRQIYLLRYEFTILLNVRKAAASYLNLPLVSVKWELTVCLLLFTAVAACAMAQSWRWSEGGWGSVHKWQYCSVFVLFLSAVYFHHRFTLWCALLYNRIRRTKKKIK